MAKGRQYAESIVGPLDRSFYDTQRNVSQKMYETNWENLQNQYKNLQEKLKKDQAEANRNFANGLVNVADNSYDRMKSANESMALKGLTSSGLNNLVEQGDITTKGAEVLDLLEKSGDVSVSVAEDLSEMNKTAAEKQNELANSLADTLGDIGARDTSAQMAYNKGLAGIAEDMEAREAENALAAAQRAASAAASGYNTDEEEAELDEFYRRKAITSLLQGVNPETGEALDLSDAQKAISLRILYDVDNGKDVVDVFNKNAKATETYNTNLKSARESKEKAGGYKAFDDAKANVVKESTSGDLFIDGLLSEYNEDGTTKVYISEDKAMEKSKDAETLLKYLKGDTSVTKEEAENALTKLSKTTKFDKEHTFYTSGNLPASSHYQRTGYDKKHIIDLDAVKKSYDKYGGNQDNLIDFKANLIFQEGTVDPNKKFNEIRKNGITYEELAELLYGSR